MQLLMYAACSICCMLMQMYENSLCLFFYETALKGGFQKFQYICFSLLC